jgi:hypothetical protein
VKNAVLARIATLAYAAICRVGSVGALQKQRPWPRCWMIASAPLVESLKQRRSLRMGPRDNRDRRMALNEGGRTSAVNARSNLLTAQEQQPAAKSSTNARASDRKVQIQQNTEEENGPVGGCARSSDNG